MLVDLEKKHKELKCFFEPEGIAVIGASTNPKKLGHQVVKNLLEGGVFSFPHLKGFPGRPFLFLLKIL